MNAAQNGVDNLDLEKLNDKDKAELRQFLANEQQRSQIQSRTSILSPLRFEGPRCPVARSDLCSASIVQSLRAIVVIIQLLL